ncbi:MAG: hypothetical protein QW123_00610 [Desulfurococcaceae archaeon]
MRNSFTITIAILLILVAVFYENLAVLAERAVWFVKTDAKTLIRVLMVSTGLILLFPEALAPIKAFTSSLEKSLKDLKFKWYIRACAIRNKRALQRLKKDLPR